MPFWTKKPKNPLADDGKVHKLPHKKRNFLAAVKSRLTGDWHSGLMTPDTENRFDVKVIRGRARDLVKNNGYAKRYVDLLQTYLVGSEGIGLQPKILDRNGKLNETVNTTLKEAWVDWGKVASIDSKQSFVEFTSLAVKTLATDGEVFVRLIRSADVKYGLRLQMIDADFLDLDYNINKNKEGNIIRQGIEMDEFGKPIVYHFWTRHPNDPLAPARGKGKRVPVPAEDVVHLYKQDRPQQTRGVSWMSSVMYSMHMLGEAKRYELIAARTSAGKMGFITKNANTPPDILDDLDSDTELEDAPARTIEVGPGQLAELDFGESFQAWNPEHPNNAFTDFTKLELRTISSGLGVSYQALSSDLEGTSFSSGRIGSVLERDYYRGLQMFLARNLHSMVYNAWLETALLSGDLKLTPKNPDLYTRIVWQPRGFLWIDPEKDLKAYERAIANGLADRTTILASLGRDVRDTFNNLAAENEMAENLGIDIDGVMGDAKEDDVTPGESRSLKRSAAKRDARPFGPDDEFSDFDDCVAKNQDKEDPEAYCATIQEATE